MKLKAFIVAGNHHQYQCFLRENHLDRREWPMLNEDNWRGQDCTDIIRIGTYFENKKLLDMLTLVENYFYSKRINHET